MWLWLRLTGSRCYAQGCGRLLVLHTPRQLDRCYDTPLGIVLTVQGWLLAQGVPQEDVQAWCHAAGIDPAARLHVLHHSDPATTVSHADVSA